MCQDKARGGGGGREEGGREEGGAGGGGLLHAKKIKHYNTYTKITTLLI